jgi:hypothetical protein
VLRRLMRDILPPLDLRHRSRDLGSDRAARPPIPFTISGIVRIPGPSEWVGQWPRARYAVAPPAVVRTDPAVAREPAFSVRNARVPELFIALVHVAPEVCSNAIRDTSLTRGLKHPVNKGRSCSHRP